MALAKGVTPASAASLDAARKAGATVEPVYPGSPLLSASFVSREAASGDKELAALAPLKANIAWLDLGRTKVGDSGLKELAGYVKLQRLNLHATSVTDAGLEALKGIPALKSLNLFGTALTDAAIPALGSLATLEDVYLRDTKVTEAGVAKLSELLPLAEVHSGFQAPSAEPGAATAKKKKKK
jgi:hypothetical protein